MPSARRIVVVGGGPSGTIAAIEAKKQDPAADVRLVTDEACEPYEKPPLSKAVLLGTAEVSDALIAGPGGVASHGVVLRTGGQCCAIDRARHEIAFADGTLLRYDALVLATGAVLRELPALPAGTPHVHYLRTEADAVALKPELQRGRRLLVIGGGLIGLEVAAAAAQRGMAVTVLEVADRILPRVCDDFTAAAIAQVHVERGVDLRIKTSLAAVDFDADDGVIGHTAAGDRLCVDVVVVGIGVRPNDRLARDAGLDCDDGIVVDEACRTSDPAIFAAGDATRFPGLRGLIRLENWKHAQDHGAVAGRNAAGAGERYSAVPSFWSEQYDLYIQGAGWSDAAGATVHRVGNAMSMLVFTVVDNHLAYVIGINAQRDMAIARRLIERRTPVDPVSLANPAQPLAALLKR